MSIGRQLDKKAVVHAHNGILLSHLNQGPHLAMTGEPRGFSRVAAAFSSYDGDLSLPLGLALGCLA